MFNLLNGSFRGGALSCRRCLVIALLLAPVAVAQRPAPADKPDCVFLDGAGPAQWRTVENRDTRCVAYFRKLLKPQKHDLAHPSTPALAQIALARMGDRPTQQQLVCLAVNGTARAQYELATYQLPRIGGAFAVRLYLRLFEADGEFHAAALREYKKVDPGDAPYSEMSGYAAQHVLEVLSGKPSSREVEIAPDGHPRNSAEITDYIKHWVLQHEEVWTGTTPTGDGVDFSGASCRRDK